MLLTLLTFLLMEHLFTERCSCFICLSMYYSQFMCIQRSVSFDKHRAYYTYRVICYVILCVCWVFSVFCRTCLHQPTIIIQKNRHTAHTIVSWFNPKVWLKYTYSYSSQERWVRRKHTVPYIVYKIMARTGLILDTHSTGYTWQTFDKIQCFQTNEYDIHAVI